MAKQRFKAEEIIMKMREVEVHQGKEMDLLSACKQAGITDVTYYRWFKIVNTTRYTGYNALKATFGSIDKVGDKIVFNIGGNKYRLIAVIHFNTGRLYVRHILTHEEYDRGGWKNG